MTSRTACGEGGRAAELSANYSVFRRGENGFCDLACVQGVDDSVGRVLDYLDQTGLAKNTIVIYSSDAGVDLLLIETMNSVREAVFAAKLATITGRPTWVSFVCDCEGRIVSGESVAVAAGMEPQDAKSTPAAAKRPKQSFCS